MADEPFKATEEDWQRIETAVDIPKADISRAVVELRNRVAALEAERVAPEASATEPTPPAAVPSDEELWELARKVKKQVTPHFNWSTWDEPHGPDFGHFVAANRALYNHGFQHGLAAGRAEKGTTPEPEPDAPQTLHSVALGHVDGLRRLGVLPQICDTLRRAIREPMAEQQAAPKPEPTHPQYFSSHHAIAGEIWGMLPDAPKPNQAPAGDRRLVEVVTDFMGLHPGQEGKARAVILAIARWLRSVGNCGSAADLEREAQR
jgi:hypothetical protein